MKPVNFAAIPPVLFRRLAYSQKTVWAVVVMSILVCAVIAWLHFQQQQTLNRATKALDTFRQARIDLLNGFLHLSLGSDPTLPFDREQGRVLLEQAIASFNSSAASFDQQGLSVSRFQAEAQAFRYHLREWRTATVTARDETELRIAFEQLETQAERLDEDIRAQLQALFRQQETIFNWALSGAAVLLAGICGAVFLAGQARQSAETERRQAEAKLRESEEWLRLAYDAAQLGIWRNDIAANIYFFDAHAREHYGVEVAEIAAAEIAPRIHPDDLERVQQEIAATIDPASSGRFATEYRVIHPDGAVHWLAVQARVIFEGEGEARRPVVGYGTSQDITARKQADANLRELQSMLAIAESVAGMGSWKWDLQTQKVSWSDEMFNLFGVDRANFDGNLDQVIANRIHPDDIEAVNRANLNVLEAGQSAPLEYRIVLPDGRQRHVWAEGTLIRDSSGHPIALTGYVQDMTARKQAEAALLASEARFRHTLDAMLEGCQIIAFDWRYLYLNDVADKHNRRPKEELLGQRYMEMWPGIETTNVFRVIRRCMEERLSQSMENEFAFPDGSTGWFELRIYPVPEGIVILSVDITERKQAEEELHQTMEELKRSNADLEQFAYIASHDLQEPLRGIAGTVQLLQRRYGGQLDERADEFIRHAVEGASRMQTLINDLLIYSRVGTRGQPFRPVELSSVLADILANLTVAIRESEAVICYDDMPTVMADRTQLIQLFQNLIVNAIKFRGERIPDIRIRAERQKGEWLFAVADNGIGLEAQYFERIFGVFQRLHTRREYPGTGIGLALCKKIVERHGGRIWVESEPGQGSTFYFTLPTRQKSKQ